MEGPSILYSPADFVDAEDMRPTSAYLDVVGNGTTTPYTTAINGVLRKHIDEMKQKSAASVMLPSGWKKRLREFMSQKNTDLLDFLKLSIPSNPTLSKGDAILRKFAATSYNPNHASLRELVLDVSGEDIISEINAVLMSIKKEDSIKDYVAATQYIFTQYRESGEEAMRQEGALKSKLEFLDKASTRLSSIVDMDPTEKYQPLLEATESYIGTLFEKHQIEETYKAFIGAYRKFVALRDVILMTRAITAYENEPLCTICLQDGVSSVLVPCGHTFCETCVKRQNGICFICRTQIREKIRMFFG
jgi:hypothetical protein